MNASFNRPHSDLHRAGFLNTGGQLGWSERGKDDNMFEF